MQLQSYITYSKCNNLPAPQVFVWLQDSLLEPLIVSHSALLQLMHTHSIYRAQQKRMEEEIGTLALLLYYSHLTGSQTYPMGVHEHGSHTLVALFVRQGLSVDMKSLGRFN